MLFLVQVYYTHPGFRTSIFGKNRAYCIRDFTVHTNKTLFTVHTQYFSSLIFFCFQRFLTCTLTCYPVSDLDLSEIKSFNGPYSLPSTISCNNSILFLSQVALSNTFPAMMSWSKLSCLGTCPSHLCFPYQTIFNMLPASVAHTNTSSFDVNNDTTLRQ